jgi:hypothetical protein
MTQLSTTLLLTAFSMYGFSMFVLFVMVAGIIFILSKHYYVDPIENIPVEEDLFIKEPIADIPVLPCPSAKDLSIDEKSKLGKIYEMLVRGDIVTNEICFRAIESKKASIFIFKLRKKGLLIDTLTMPDLSVGYKFRKFNYDKTI